MVPPPRYTAPSANAARNFTCNLCNKSYARQNDYDVHLSSYDHSHRARSQNMAKLTAQTGQAKQSKRTADGEMRPVSFNMEGVTKKRGGGGFTKIQDINKKAKTSGGFTKIQDLNKDQDVGEMKKDEVNKPQHVTLKGFTRIGGPKKEDDPKQPKKEVLTGSTGKDDSAQYPETSNKLEEIRAKIEMLQQQASRYESVKENTDTKIGVEKKKFSDDDTKYDYKYYDPRTPTGCPPDCRSRYVEEAFRATGQVQSIH
ncbi:hypothetical protein GQ43DRAFT_470976 [Delitschia confertaspora ATCC 74209]|uniref:C2H2-type domain-containing protein n=1 Tax=Delitschia confertaspora ATCC 74209 TaxID=1513339 RepID=A0A9P4JQ72_9PLEO|nr:hypothetical protein GQ43DRAFT_470976 [Delitschia confertaspora ATCC 74209]